MEHVVLKATAWRIVGAVMAVFSFGLLVLLAIASAHHLSVVSQSVLPVQLGSGEAPVAAWSCRLPRSILDWSPHCQRFGPTPLPTALGVSLSGAVALSPLLILAFAMAQATLSYLDISRGRLLTSLLARRTMRFAISALAFLVIASVSTPIATWVMEAFTDVFRAAAGHEPTRTIAPTALSADPVLSWLTPFLAASLAIHAAMLVKASAIAEDHAQIV